MVLPVKSFRDAKARLAPALDPDERRSLARSLADRVVDAAGALPVFVVCDDDEVAAWARGRGAEVVDPGEPGLDRAAHAGVRALARRGFAVAVVAHADLLHATDLSPVLGFDGITLVPDRHGDGTNVIALPVRSGFRFAYGPGSFARHEREARRLGLAVRVLRDESLAWDVDTPDDLG